MLLLLFINHTLSHMFLQSAGHTEGHGTEPTLENILAKTAVGFHMSRQFARLGAAVRAQLALVRLLAGVAATVHG